MEPDAQKDLSKIPDDAVLSSQGRQSMAGGLKGEAQNRISSLQQLDRSQKVSFAKDIAEDSDVDSGHNSIDRHSLATETPQSYAVPKLSDIQTDYGRDPTNIWIDSTISPENNYVVDVGDSVIYHDPIQPTEEDTCEKSSKEEAKDGVFTAIARKKSVFITVDKWTTEAITVKEVPSEIHVNAGSTSPEVTYAKVNKKMLRAMEKGGIESSDEALYGEVDKDRKNKERENVQANVDGCYEELVDGQNTDDIGDADDLYSDVDQDQRRNARKNLYAFVGGKVMIVSDDGDYASVKSMTDSDSSRNTEATVVPDLPVTGNANQSSLSEDASNKRNRYAVQYLGSVPIGQEELSSQRCTVSVAQCISHMSQQSHRSHDKQSIYEWPKNSRMFLETCESKRVLTLLSSDSVAVRDKHFLSSIRIWAVGKEANSKHFAYVIRNASQRHVCRVFLCDVAARHIASTIRNICHRLAMEQLEKSKRKSVDSILWDSATDVLKHGRTVSAMNESSGVSLMRPTDKKCVVTECNYIGKIKASKSPGKDLLNSTTESVFAKISKEKWARVDLQLSQTSITIKQLSNSDGKSVIFPKESVIYMGSSTKNRKLSAIFVQSDDHVTYVHVFHCEPHAEEFIKQLQAACGISPIEKNGESTNQPLFQQKGLKGLLFGKSKGKKQGNENYSQ